MASGTNYSQEYGQAEKAYLQEDFERAAQIIDRLAEEFPEDPNVLLLRGHIYCYGLQNYDLAQQQYEAVLELSEEQDLLDFAYNGIEQVQQLRQQFETRDEACGKIKPSETVAERDINDRDWMATDFADDKEFLDKHDEDKNRYDFELEDDYLEPVQIEEEYLENIVPQERDGINTSFMKEREENWEEFHGNSGFLDPFAQFDLEDNEQDMASFISQESREPDSIGYQPIANNMSFMVDSDEDEENSLSESESFGDYLSIDSLEENNFSFELSQVEKSSSQLELDTVLTEAHGGQPVEDVGAISDRDGFEDREELEFDEIDSSFFDLEELERGLPDTGLFNVQKSVNSDRPVAGETNPLVQEPNLIGQEQDRPGESSISSTSTSTEIIVEPTVEIKQGPLAGFTNASMRKKQLVTAGITGIVSAIAVGFTIGLVGSNVADRDNVEERSVNPLIALVAAGVAGISSFGTTMLFGSFTAKQVERATKDLQNQFEDVYQGNLNAKATVFSQDELGRLAAGFNRMTGVILTTTQEAQRRAEETEQAKEDLQRQVIRLLDDVEGAARGDLTVQATVTADVLGAVADAFNLTIQSLREIVRQVKQAAEQVNKSSTDSELFARNQSSEALRMAEELAVTLNSVQMMTESIERVAESAREAEEVARSSSVTALKGGNAVERTVSGILQIRETVSETARKVKRLAEASQEISKIVLLISQIAERTNQLALNASIQAAKAGEAGRGFAVVADEVRQLADRSAKSLKEIEQIVLQIQSETGSVMTAMEEGIQEVIDVTNRAEQAKKALEDIIHVSNRIDTLVRSITADTVEQRENSRAVAQVMQSVELTAQATSQESQRVAGSLQNLVSIARALLSSVERFRIDKNEG
ncbi:HAMP domain-containing protein [Pleurocapsales cyanobacterium LEGE 06147]|nr:HAMP domain-containing protein [Pleurocapsales cyanobacterium LEGE 06147]